RCISGYEIDDVVRKAADLSINVIVRGLSEIGARPSDTGFLCLTENRETLEVRSYSDGGSAKMYYMRGPIADMFERLLEMKARLEQIEQRQKELIIGTAR